MGMRCAALESRRVSPEYGCQGYKASVITTMLKCVDDYIESKAFITSNIKVKSIIIMMK